MCCDGVGGQVACGLAREALALRLSPPDRGDLAIVPCSPPVVPWRTVLAINGFARLAFLRTLAGRDSFRTRSVSAATARRRGACSFSALRFSVGRSISLATSWPLVRNSDARVVVSSGAVVASV